MKVLSESPRLPANTSVEYAVRLAHSQVEIHAAQALRFAVFNLELHEGLAQSYASQRDEDEFDAVCDHLLVEHRATGQVIGTYRLQTGSNATLNRGYYSEQEFDFSGYEGFREQIIELGRACVHRQHRNLNVLGLLWQGIADYARARGGRYLMGCSSLTSQDAAVGAAAYAELCRRHLAPAAWRTTPLPVYACPLTQTTAVPVELPKLLRAYLTLGAKICGPPALDRGFKTIDFLTLLDLQSLHPLARLKFFGI